ncbi:MAG: hypothetical protein IAE89_08660 [Anaerolineae bacterium]|nr:hypothetical protein [Anaerolineae bacterium]
MSETLRYHTVAELRSLSLDELRALWELVPTDRQRSYRAAYDREVKSAGAEGSDAKERKIALALLKRYHESALVPIGMRWARTPKRVQEAAQHGERVDASETEAAAKSGKPSGKVLAVLGAMMFGMVALMLLRGTGDTDVINGDNVTATATLPADVTPTPLALEAQDDVIEGGDTSRAPFYPINLQISVPDESVPRVWVVQRRAVRASEWNFDPNPDTASFLNGMSVRPVIGIPWSEDNAAWFAQIAEGAEFRLQMNTGAILTFDFEDKREVRRSDTGIFRQVNPGLVLLLLGETDEEGLPTVTRTLVTAAYPVNQELGRMGELIGVLAQPVVVVTPTPLPTVTPTPIPFISLDVQIISITTQVGQITTQFRLYNGGSLPLPITPDDLWLALGYGENPPGPRAPAEGLAPINLLPGQAADMTLVWLWQGEPFGSLGIGDYRYNLQF